jgi:RNA polymerase sigma-70 factor (ECF subfamily)
MNPDPGPQTERACAGDREALDALWRAHRAWIGAVLYAHSNHFGEVEDLLQEVAAIVVSEIATLRNPAKLRPWLRSIAMNVARGAARRDMTRRRIVRPLVDGEEAWIPDRRDSAQRAASTELQNLMIRLEWLPPDYREPLLLQAVHAMSQKQIAATLDIPETTVETRLARARRMLRESMAPKPSDNRSHIEQNP